MTDQRDYVAFISYRHKPLDKALATTLHKLLEHYIIPTEYRNSPKEKHLGIVFRDRDELPLSSHLSQDIYTALDHSQYLIVICTQDTPHSEWVRREIEYFIQNHGRDRVLTVLAQDPPELCFPEQLTKGHSPDGTAESEDLEPLAAYVAGKNVLHSLLLLTKEFKRLVAAILQVPYGQLMQRQKRRRQRQIILGLSALTAIAFGFVGMLLNRNAEISKRNEQISQQNQQILAQNEEIQEKNRQVEEQLQQTLKNESLSLAQLSLQQLESGDRTGALTSALQALPSADLPRPYVPAAEYALANALYAYQPKQLRYDITVSQPTTIYAMRMSEDGQYVVTLDELGRLRCFELQYGSPVWEYQLEGTQYKWKYDVAKADFYSLNICESQVIFSDQDHTLLLDLTTGSFLRSLDHSGYDIEGLTVSDDGSLLMLLTFSWQENQIHRNFTFYDLATCKIIQSITYSGPTSWDLNDFIISSDNSRLALAFSTEEGLMCQVSCVDIPSGQTIYDQTFDLHLHGAYFTLSDKIHLTMLSDHRLVLYYSQDTEYPEDLEFYMPNIGMEAHVRIYSPEGEQLSHLIYEEKNATGTYLQHVASNESCILYDLGDHLVMLDLDKLFLSSHLVNSNSFPLGCYCSDHYGVYLLEDGSLHPITNGYHQNKYPYPDLSMDLIGTLGIGGENEIIGVIPADSPNQIHFLRMLWDQQSATIQEPPINFMAPRYQVCGFPSGDRFVILDHQNPGWNYRYKAAVYDSVSLEKMAEYSFTLSESTSIDLTGFSADENKLIFRDHAFDLDTQEVIKHYTDDPSHTILPLDDYDPYDLEMEISDAIEKVSAQRMCLLNNNTALLIQHDICHFTIADPHNSEVLAQYSLEKASFSEYEDYVFTVDPKRGTLYLYNCYGEVTGLCISLETWDVVTQIPYLICPIPGGDRILCTDRNQHEILAYPLYSLDDLITQGEQILSHTDET